MAIALLRNDLLRACYHKETRYVRDRHDRGYSKHRSGVSQADPRGERTVAIGRIQTKQIGLSTPYSITVSYKNGVNGSSSVLLDTYRNGADDAYSYTYDANNNILSVAQGEASSSYVYDAANQLVRANIYNSSTDNYTATYTYDGNGNITAKSIYPYTIGELGTATSTIQYGYETAGWTD